MVLASSQKQSPPSTVPGASMAPTMGRVPVEAPVQLGLVDPGRLARPQDDGAGRDGERGIVGEDGIGQAVVLIGVDPVDGGTVGLEQRRECIELGGQGDRVDGLGVVPGRGVGREDGTGAAHGHVPQRAGHRVDAERSSGRKSWSESTAPLPRIESGRWYVHRPLR